MKFVFLSVLVYQCIGVLVRLGQLKAEESR